MMPNEKKLAVLIDGDNAPASRAAALFAEVAKYGLASVKRVYGDWSSPTLNSWQKILLKHALVPVQQFAYTKNKDATDMGLVIEAMDLLYSAKFDGFCLVSSDSDFTPLASRIRGRIWLWRKENAGGLSQFMRQIHLCGKPGNAG